MKKINVTKTFLPPRKEYDKFLDTIWSSGQLTNQGQLLERFEREMMAFLEIKDFNFVANGTLALQLAIRTLGSDGGEIITTPFSYVATTSAILWEHYDPVYVDINPNSLCIDPEKIESAITDKTKAILPVHVFGNPCDIEAIEVIAKKHNLLVIYDASHAFGVKYKGKSLLDFGDISTCSFHSTKLFHTIEGGCIVAKNKKRSGDIELMKRFGHTGDDYYRLGINAKASEFQAAMGLCNLEYINKIIKERQQLSEVYDHYLSNKITKIRPDKNINTIYNYSYYPVVFKDEKALKAIIKKLNAANIFPRRYFYPSLNTLPYLSKTQICPLSEDISKRIACLPIYSGLKNSEIKAICEIINT